jgi:hypothetical protein
LHGGAAGAAIRLAGFCLTAEGAVQLLFKHAQTPSAELMSSEQPLSPEARALVQARGWLADRLQKWGRT